MRCVGYAKRKSCADSRVDVPIKEQNDRIRAYCKEHGHELVGLYEDKSDDVTKDSGFLKLKADGMVRRFDFVVVDSVYRCGMTASNARDVLEMTFFPAGIGFVILEDGFCSYGRTMEELDNYFIDAIRTATLRPFADKRRNDWANGIFSVHDEKYGYLLSEDRKSFAIDEEAAPIIRKIFELADSGMKMTEITDYMNEHGYEAYGTHLRRVAQKRRPQLLDVWTVGAVKTILTTTSYKGVGTRNLDGITYEYDIPAIVSTEMYDRVQKQLEKRSTKGRKNSERMKNAFSHRIFDGDTGNRVECIRLESGEPVFAERKWRPDRYVSYADVMRAAVKALREEKRISEKAVRFFDTYQCDRYLSNKRDELYDKGVSAFQDITAAENGNIPLYQSFDKGDIKKEDYDRAHQEILDNIRAKTECLDKLIEEEELLLKKYSSNNPWVKLYSGISIPAELTQADVKRWIEKVLLYDYERIEVVMKHQVWRIKPQ